MLSSYRVLDLTDVTPIVDFFVICTGTSRRQMHAIAEEVEHDRCAITHKVLLQEGPGGREAEEE